jgi:hypothetical protein
LEPLSSCAAADDITAWCILAAVIAIVKAGSFASSIYVILMAIAYVFLMIKIVRPFLKRIANCNPVKELSANRSLQFFLNTDYLGLCHGSDWNSRIVWSVYGWCDNAGKCEIQESFY